MTFHFYINHQSTDSIPVIPLDNEAYRQWLDHHATKTEQTYLESVQFKIKDHHFALLADDQGRLTKVIIGVDAASLWSLSCLYQQLPEGRYYLQDEYGILDPSLALLGFGLGAYQFDKYKIKDKRQVSFYLPDHLHHLDSLVESVFMVRNLINTPAEDMGPAQLSAFVKELAGRHSAEFNEITGNKLLKANFPSIHTVGRAAKNKPRLIDMTWGDEQNPKVTLVGKGVCFDTGGLDIKPANGMLIMHKDMGGAAHVIGLANLIMANQLPVRLRVLIPAVENSISSNAYRPSDVITTRCGKTVQVLNTDAEGRLVLCDALSEAAAEQPDLLVDMATLTGASRVALGAEVPSVFANNQDAADQLTKLAGETQDPLWQMPLYQPYKQYLDSDIADMGNVAPTYPYGGAIIAALFLESFVPSSINWMHFDIGAWNFSNRPGRPKGGECMGIRALYQLIDKSYNSAKTT